MPWATGRSADAILARSLWAARAHGLRGDTAAARGAYDSAVAILDSRERTHPDDGDVHGMRGVILAALGRRADALREVRWLAQSDAYRKDGDVAAVRAEILATVGETDAALTDVGRALAGPSTVTIHVLRLCPSFDPIRNDPRFQALLVKYDLAAR